MPVVDLKFMVHNQQQVKDATKSLLEFNTANVQRAANYDKVAAADIRQRGSSCEPTTELSAPAAKVGELDVLLG